MASSTGYRFGMPDSFMTQRLDILSVLRMAFEGAPNAIFVAEEDGTILFANEAAAVTFHYAADELIGQPISRLFYPLAVAAADRTSGPSSQLTEALEALTSHTVDGMRSDGVIVPLEVRVKRTADGAR